MKSPSTFGFSPLAFAFATGLVYAVGIKYFIRPAGVILTGTEGIAISTSYYFASEALFVLLYALFQAALLAFSFLKIGLSFSVKTLVTVATVAILVAVLPGFRVASPESENERIVLVLFGSIIMGAGKALSLRNRGSTGDEDIIAVYFSERLRKPVGKVIIVAGIIAGAYGLALDFLKFGSLERTLNTLIYTVIFLFMTAETVNLVYKRYRFSALEIVTEHATEIGASLSSILPGRSMTRSKAVGSFSGTEKDLITVVLTQEELPEALRAVESLDAKCFAYHYELQGIQGRFNWRNYQ